MQLFSIAPLQQVFMIIQSHVIFGWNLNQDLRTSVPSYNSTKKIQSLAWLRPRDKNNVFGLLCEGQYFTVIYSNTVTE